MPLALVAARAAEAAPASGQTTQVLVILLVVLVVVVVVWAASKLSLGQIIGLDIGCCLIESLGCSVAALVLLVTMASTVVGALQTFL